ncbi:hypothetical protein PC123_g8711 [Phytophthora cactorum]|nr:hypothetical protein PC123_g8711 [Phytophthora cactorum]
MEDLPTLLSCSAVFRAPAAHKPTGMELFDDNDDDMRASAATVSFREVNASDSSQSRTSVTHCELGSAPASTPVHEVSPLQFCSRISIDMEPDPTMSDIVSEE